MNNIDLVKKILKQYLKLGDRVEEFNASTLLLGDIPELDSMSIVGIIGAIEEYWGVTINDDDISAEVFESVGTLMAFIERKLEEL